MELTPLRLRAEPRVEDRLSILGEAAQIAEGRANDPAWAFGATRQAFAIAPGDSHLHAEMTRLAEVTGQWSEFVAAYRDAIDTLASSNPPLTVLLWRSVGVAREARLNDVKGALDAYLCAIAIGTDAESSLAASRVAAVAGEWDVAAAVLVDLARETERTPTEGLDEIERAAAAAGAWDEVTRALSEAAASGQLRGAPARDIIARVADWHLHRRGDEGAAEAALERALAHDGANAQLLSLLVERRRRRPGGPLVDALTALSEATGGRLSLLREACDVARDAGDVGLATELAGKAFELARTRWLEPGAGAGEDGEDGEEDPRACAQWAIETLAHLHDQSGEPQALLDVLILGESLPFDLGVRLGMRKRAARTALDRLSDVDRAIALYGSLFEHDPTDAEAAERLAAIYAAKGRTRDLLRMRERQIEAAAEIKARVLLRLEAGRLLATLGESAAAVGMFQASLAEQPDDRATVEELALALAGQARHDELRDLFRLQAEIAEQASSVPIAADFWCRAAAWRKTRCTTPHPAAAYHARVVALAPRAASLEALARLARDRGDPSAAAAWLERWLEVEPEQRIGATLQLADALVAAGQPDGATARIERSIAQNPDAEPLRTRLAALYRDRGDWPNLARATADAAAHAPDKATRMARVLAAADLFAIRCGEPDKAVPLLEQASDLTPDDQHGPARARARPRGSRTAGRRSRHSSFPHRRIWRQAAAGARARPLSDGSTRAREWQPRARAHGARHRGARRSAERGNFGDACGAGA